MTELGESNMKVSGVSFECLGHEDGSATLYRTICNKIDTVDCEDIEVAKAVARRLSGYECLVSKKRTKKYRKSVDEIIAMMERPREDEV